MLIFYLTAFLILIRIDNSSVHFTFQGIFASKIKLQGRGDSSSIRSFLRVVFVVVQACVKLFIIFFFLFSSFFLYFFDFICQDSAGKSIVYYS